LDNSLNYFFPLLFFVIKNFSFTEFERLYSKVFPEKQIDEKNIREHVKELAAILGIVIIRKGFYLFLI